MQILILCNLTCLYLYFCYCSVKESLHSAAKDKEKRLLFDVSWKVTLQQKCIGFILACRRKRWHLSCLGIKELVVKCQDVPVQTPQCYKCMDQHHEDAWPYSASVCGWITDQAGETHWQQIPEHKWANGRRTWKDEPNLHLVPEALLYYSLREIIMEHNPAFSPLLLQTICTAI